MEYDKWRAYQQAKLANYLFSMEAAKKYDPSKIVAFGVHPGFVRSNLGNHVSPSGILGTIAMTIFYTFIDTMSINTEHGAHTSLHCILSDVDALENGAFYSQTGPYVGKEDRLGGWPFDIKAANPEFVTDEAASKLWDESVKMVEE